MIKLQKAIQRLTDLYRKIYFEINPGDFEFDAAMSEKSCFHLETYLHIYFKLKTDVSTA